jgi:hypothetical protein
MLPGMDRRAVYEALPGSDENERQRCRLAHAEIGGLVSQQARVGHHELGERSRA